jgi:hypothetical protein
MTDSHVLLAGIAAAPIAFFGLARKRRKKPAELLVIGCFSSLLAFFVETLADWFGWWEFTLDHLHDDAIELITNICFFPFEGLIYYIFLSANYVHNILIAGLLAGIYTFAEYTILAYADIIIYHPPWNLYLTYISYFIPLLLIWWFWLFLQKRW